MAQTEVDIASTELERVRSTVPRLFYRDDTFYSHIKKKPAEWVSERAARIPLQLQQGGDFGHFDPKGGSLGRGTGSKYTHATIQTKHIRLAYEYQMLADKAANMSRKSVVNNVRNLLANAMQEMRHYCDNLQIHDGTGVLAKITAVSGGVVTCGDENGIKLLREGQPVIVIDDTTTTVRTTTATNNLTRVTKFDPENSQVTLNPTPSNMVANDRILVAGFQTVTGAISGTPSSVLGLKYHYDNASSGMWLNINRANYPQIRSSRVTASGSLSLAHVRLARNRIGDRYGLPARRNMSKVMIWAHAGQLQQYESLGQLVSMIPKKSRDEGLDLYFGENMMMAGLKTMEHASWDKTRLDIVDFDIWGRVVMYDTDYYTVGGQKIFEVRASDGGVAASNMFYLVSGYNTYIDNPMRTAYVSDLTKPSGY